MSKLKTFKEVMGAIEAAVAAEVAAFRTPVRIHLGKEEMRLLNSRPNILVWGPGSAFPTPVPLSSVWLNSFAGALSVVPTGAQSELRVEVEQPMVTMATSVVTTVGDPGFPHVCPRCGGPAYVSAFTVDCQRKCH